VNQYEEPEAAKIERLTNHPVLEDPKQPGLQETTSRKQARGHLRVLKQPDVEGHEAAKFKRKHDAGARKGSYLKCLPNRIVSKKTVNGMIANLVIWQKRGGDICEGCRNEVGLLVCCAPKYQAAGAKKTTTFASKKKQIIAGGSDQEEIVKQQEMFSKLRTSLDASTGKPW
jgi:hypothetical protein